jgi:hypothetical protein
VTTARDSAPSSFEQRAVRRIARNILVLGALAPLVAYVAGAPTRILVGIAIGALVAAANFLAFEKIAGWVVRGSVRVGSLLMALLVVKMTAAMAAVFIIVRAFGVDALGFVVGLSTLVVGLFAEALQSARAQQESA